MVRPLLQGRGATMKMLVELRVAEKRKGVVTRERRGEKREKGEKEKREERER